MSTKLRDLHGAMTHALNTSQPCKVGMVEKQLGAVFEKRMGLLDLSFQLNKVTALEPSTGPLPYAESRNSMDESVDELILPLDSGIDLGARPASSEAEMSPVARNGGLVGTFLDSRSSSGLRSSRQLTHETPDLAEVSFNGEFPGGALIFGLAWASPRGYEMLAEYSNFPEPGEQFLRQLLGHPSAPTLGLLRPREQRIIACTTTRDILVNDVRVTVQPGINVIFLAYPPEGIDGLISTGNGPLVFFSTLPENDSKTIFMLSAPQFTVQSDGLRLSRGFFVLRSGPVKQNGVWDSEDGGYRETRIELRGTASIGASEVPMLAPLVAKHETLQFRSLAREFKPALLGQWDAFMGGNGAWRANDLNPDTPCRLRCFEHHRDLASGIVSSTFLQLELPDMEIKATPDLTVNFTAPLFQWRVGFPYVGGQVHATASGSATLRSFSRKKRDMLTISDLPCCLQEAPTRRYAVQFKGTGATIRGLVSRFGAVPRYAAAIGDTTMALIQLVQDANGLALEAWPIPEV